MATPGLRRTRLDDVGNRLLPGGNVLVHPARRLNFVFVLIELVFSFSEGFGGTRFRTTGALALGGSFRRSFHGTPPATPTPTPYSTLSGFLQCHIDLVGRSSFSEIPRFDFFVLVVDRRPPFDLRTNRFISSGRTAAAAATAAGSILVVRVPLASAGDARRCLFLTFQQVIALVPFPPSGGTGCVEGFRPVFDFPGDRRQFVVDSQAEIIGG
uniref:Uncharacterized protein n=1 Tax=Schlesneria paludicola TaxID=360056 RepID=A0A7C2JYT4_9PLAN